MNKKSKKLIVCLLFLFLILSFCIALKIQNINEKKYNNANTYFKNGEYSKAKNIYLSLGKYSNSKHLVKKMDKFIKQKNIYDNALKEYNNGNFEKSIEKFEKILKFEDSEEMIKKSKFGLAKQYFKNEEYDNAKTIFEEIVNFDNFFSEEDYEYIQNCLQEIDIKSIEKKKKDNYEKAKKYYKNKQYSEALEYFNSILGYSDSNKMAEKCKRKLLSHTISAGIEYVLAIDQDNRVLSVGDDSFSEQSGVYSESWNNIVSIDGYGEVTIGLKNNGKVKVCGNLSEEQKKKIQKWEHIIDISAGEKYVVALKNNGEVVTEGHNGNEQRNLDAWKGKKIVDIDAGWSTTVGLTEDGELLFAGKKADELKDEYNTKKDEWMDVTKISVSGGEPNEKSNSRGDIHIVGLKANRKVVHLGVQAHKKGIQEDETVNWKKIVDIAAGDWYTVGLDEDGQVLITGENYPQMTVGNFSKTLEHTKYIEESKIKKWNNSNIKGIAAGYGMTIVLKENEKLDIMGFTDVKSKGKKGKGELKKVLEWTDLMLPE